jgi:glycosyltransferase involved in cell wall biosynthesis
VTVPAALERLRGSPRPRVLFLSHAFGGGVGRHIDELAGAIAADAEVLLLQPHLDSFLALRWLGPGENLALWVRAADEWERLVELLQAIGIDRIHFHHVHGLPRGILELPRRLGCPHDVTLHDFFPACPAYHLTGADGRYCGGDPRCRQCTDARPAQWGLSIDEWRSTFGELLAKAARVIAPSQDAARRIGAFFPSVAPVVWPHPEAEAPAPRTPLRVLVPGAISPAKGLDVLEACVRDAARRALPLHFRVAGFTARPIPSWPELPFSIAGEYRERDLDALIALEKGDVFFFPAQCPETFSYTLSAALATPLPIVATDLGALPERLAGRGNARIVRHDAAAAAMNDAILEAAATSSARAGSARDRMAPDAYRARYLEGLRRSGAAGPALPTVPSRWLESPRHSPELSSFAWLYDDAIRCGRAASREELVRRAAEVDAQLAELSRAREELARSATCLADRETELASARAESARVAAEAAAGRERVRAMESSRSWRMTAALRALARMMRRQG